MGGGEVTWIEWKGPLGGPRGEQKLGVGKGSLTKEHPGKTGGAGIGGPHSRERSRL